MKKKHKIKKQHKKNQTSNVKEKSSKEEENLKKFKIGMTFTVIIVLIVSTMIVSLITKSPNLIEKLITVLIPFLLKK